MILKMEVGDIKNFTVLYGIIFYKQLFQTKKEKL